MMVDLRLEMIFFNREEKNYLEFRIIRYLGILNKKRNS